ncbi:MAG: glycosyltransferase [Calditrichaceae bacterium]|nr:glycosyltransferase [Calditrichia bacterium]NUQ43194.1 glycosyltransferase [Calditrichaceae bacterium]
MKKVLIIAYYWPPAGGPGVQRVLRFVNYLPQFGWQPVVLTVEKGDYPAIDESLLGKIPPECKVYKTPILEPHRLYRKFTGKARDEKLPTYVLTPKSGDSFKDRFAKWLRRNVFIPDSRIGWIPGAVKAGGEILQSESIDLIFSSSPPHTVQLIAKKLARRSGKKWIADFRDPWTEAFWAKDLPKTALSKRIDLSLEKSVLRAADAVTTVSAGVAQMFAAKAGNRYRIIHNGFEPPEIQKNRSETFRIMFSGHLSKHQPPEALFRAVDLLPEALKAKTEIVFVGNVFEGFEEIFRRYRHLNVQRKPYLPHRELMQYGQGVAVLFNPIVRIDYAESIVGAKLYDYLALRKPILAVGDRPGISEAILQETGSGKVLAYEDIEGIAGFLREQYRLWERDGYILLDNEARLVPYTTRYNVEELVRLFEDVLASREGSVKK